MNVAHVRQSIVDDVSAAIGATLRIPEVRARKIRPGYEPKGTTAQELATIMAADAARWTPVIKDVGFRGE